MNQKQFKHAISREDEEKQPLRVNPDLYEQAKGMMTQEQIDDYKKMGEEMYATVDFNNSEILNNPPDPLVESVAYILDGLRSGLHPSYLSEVEVNMMEEWDGKEWYKKFGWDSMEL